MTLSRSRADTTLYFGLTAIAVGTVFARSLTPQDPGAFAHALVVPAAFLSAALLAAPVYAALTVGWRAALRAEYLVLAAVVNMLLVDLIQGLYNVDMAADSIRDAFGAIGLFGACVLVGAAKRPWRLPRVVRDTSSARLSSNVFFRLVLIAFALGMFNFAYTSGFSPSVMLTGLTAARFDAPWSRGSLGDWGALPEHLEYFGYLLPTLTVLLRLSRGRWLDLRVAVAILCSVVMVAFLAQGGGRRVIWVVVGGAVLTWLGAECDRLRLRKILTAGCIAAFLVAFSNLVLAYRSTGYSDVHFQHRFFKEIRVDDNFLRLAQIIDVVPAEQPHVGFEWPLYVLVRPIPRALWPDKPQGIGFSLSDYYGYQSVTLSCSVIGEWYLSFGWFGVMFGGLLLGAVARAWSQLLETAATPTESGMYAMGAMALVVSVRSLIEIVLMNYTLLAWFVLHALWARRATRRARVPVPA